MAQVADLGEKQESNSEDAPHHVVGAIDDNMVYPLLVWAWSLVTKAETPLFFTVGFLTGKLTPKNQRQLSDCLSDLGIEHEFRELDWDQRFISQGHISPTTFAKFLLADTTPGSHVWIDVDAVGQQRWDHLFSEINQVSKGQLLVVAGRNTRGKSGLGSASLAFNAGVLGWPAKMRRDWSAHLDTMGVVETQEQQLFNDLYGDALAMVSEDFNTLSYRVDSLNAHSRTPRIIHFAGPQKPWHLNARFRPLCRRHQCPWSAWFVEEAGMLRALQSTPRHVTALEMRRAAGKLGPVPVGRANRGRLLLWILSALGPFGWFVVGLGAIGRRMIPSGTHPLH